MREERVMRRKRVKGEDEGRVRERREGERRGERKGG